MEYALTAVSENTLNIKYFQSNWTLRTDAYNMVIGTFAHLWEEGSTDWADIYEEI